MRKFVSSLNRATDRFASESSTIRDSEDKLQNKFYGIQSHVRKSLIVKPAPKTNPSAYSHPPHVKRAASVQKKDEKIIKRKYHVKTPLYPQQARFGSISNKKEKCRSSLAANRIYNSHATQKMYADILYGYADYLENPTPSAAVQYESQIDPILHVGRFESNEVNQTGTIVPLYTTPPNPVNEMW